MLKFLLEKEIKQIRRNKFLPRVIIVFPFMALLVLPLAANFEVKNINLSIVDNDCSRYSTRLIQKIVSSGYFKLTNYSSTYREALRAVELDYADIILEIRTILKPTWLMKRVHGNGVCNTVTEPKAAWKFLSFKHH
jgi:ABC-2 type transport system permease protein